MRWGGVGWGGVGWGGVGWGGADAVRSSHLNDCCVLKRGWAGGCAKTPGHHRTNHTGSSPFPKQACFNCQVQQRSSAAAHLPACVLPPHMHRVGDTWHVLPALPPTSAVLLFGLCTAWRSNDRLRAAEHRMADAAAGGPAGTSRRRLSAVLFLGMWVADTQGRGGAGWLAGWLAGWHGRQAGRQAWQGGMTCEAVAACGSSGWQVVGDACRGGLTAHNSW